MKRVIHAELYRIIDGEPEFLLIKRVPDDGGFWQPVTGGIEEGEDVGTSLLREVAEETGVTNILHVSRELHRTVWDYNGGEGSDLVHAVQVHHESEIVLNPLEHNQYDWLPFEQALARLYFDGNKESMRIVYKYIRNRHS